MIKLARADPERPGIRRPGNGRAASDVAIPGIAVTERALDALVALRTAEHAMPGQALGLVVGPYGSVGLVLDLPGARDRVFSRNDTPIFFIDPEIGTRFKGRLLDHDGPPGQEGFKLENHRLDDRPPTSNSGPP